MVKNRIITKKSVVSTTLLFFCKYSLFDIKKIDITVKKINGNFL
jgi:hypothetical protein